MTTGLVDLALVHELGHLDLLRLAAVVRGGVRVSVGRVCVAYVQRQAMYQTTGPLCFDPRIIG